MKALAFLLTASILSLSYTAWKGWQYHSKVTDHDLCVNLAHTTAQDLVGDRYSITGCGAVDTDTGRAWLCTVEETKGTYLIPKETFSCGPT